MDVGESGPAVQSTIPSRRAAEIRALGWLRRYSQSLISPMIVALFFVGFAGQGLRNIFGLYGASILTAILILAFFVVFFSAGRTLSLRRFPSLVSLFVAWCCLSIIWSYYPQNSALSSLASIGVTATGVGIGIAVTLEDGIDLLIRAFQWILGVSYALELFVAVVLREKLAPLPMRDLDEIPELYYWINDALFKGGPIQGFMGNRNPLAFVAMLLILALALRWISGDRRIASTALWITVGVATLALTRSATTLVTLIGCVAVIIGFALVRWARPEHRRRVVALILLGAVATIVGGILSRRWITAALGKSPDLTGRGDIWRTLFPLWLEHPILGWGWTIGWPTDDPLFHNLVPRADGTPTNQAHNAYIEALFQTGIIGALILICAVIWVFVGVLRAAVRRIDESMMTCVPTVFVTALIIQSMTESRLLSEGNWMLFVVMATWLKVRADIPDIGLDRMLGTSEQ